MTEYLDDTDYYAMLEGLKDDVTWQRWDEVPTYTQEHGQDEARAITPNHVQN